MPYKYAICQSFAYLLIQTTLDINKISPDNRSSLYIIFKHKNLNSAYLFKRLIVFVDKDIFYIYYNHHRI